MNSIKKKRGFGLTGGLFNRFGATFIEAPVDIVSSALSEYWKADRKTELSIKSFCQLEKGMPDMHFLWQYQGQDWTNWWGFNDENITFTLALFLNTKTMTIAHQGTSNWTEVKIFQDQQLIEQYYFGCEAFEPDKKIGHLFWSGKVMVGHNYWDVEMIQDFYSPNSPLPFTYRHLFCSSIRDLTETEIGNILSSRNDEFGLLDWICKRHNLYFPDLEETPFNYNFSVEDWKTKDSEIMRIDGVILPKQAFYWDNMLPVPERVIKGDL